MYHRPMHWKVLLLSAMLTPLPSGAADLIAGKRAYDQHCASCHGFDGRSRFPDVPDLRSLRANVLPDPETINRLKMGSSRKAPFIGRLTDQELADALLYTRTLR